MPDSPEASQHQIPAIKDHDPRNYMGRLKSFRRINRLIGILYGAIAFSFFFFPAEVFYLINVGPKVFRITEAIPDSPESFWRVFAAASFITLSAICFLAAETPKIRGYSILHLLNKIVSGACFLWLLSKGQHIFAYALGAFAEFFVFTIIAWITFRVPHEK